MDDSLALGDLATFSVDRDKDLLINASANSACSFFLLRPPGLPGCPFGNGCATAGCRGRPYVSCDEAGGEDPVVAGLPRAARQVKPAYGAKQRNCSGIS
jgi:hypothetical protein